MAANMVEAIERIKKAGPNNVRSVPMPGQNAITGLCQVEILVSGKWEPIVEGLPATTATDLIRQGTNRVICG